MGLFMSKILDKKLKDQFIGFFIILVLFQNHEKYKETLKSKGEVSGFAERKQGSLDSGASEKENKV